MGLYLVQAILERMNGFISLSSQEGMGSAFTFSIPILKEPKSSQTKISTASHLRNLKEGPSFELSANKEEIKEEIVLESTLCPLMPSQVPHSRRVTLIL